MSNREAGTSPSQTFDLDAYLARIGYGGPLTPNLTTLRALHALQPARIPFENLDPLLGRPVRLDLASLQAKLIGERRGGYCFELNLLFAAALAALGFSVTNLSARVRWMAPPERPDGARGHMLICVDLDEGPHLVDVGFGGHLFAAPIRLEPDIEQSGPAGKFRLTGGGHILTLQVLLADVWQDAYRFTFEPQVFADFEVASWFTSTNPASYFVTNLLAERLTPEGRFSISNTRLTHRRSDGSVEQRTLAGHRELGEALETGLAITPPVDPAEIWARLPKD